MTHCAAQQVCQLVKPAHVQQAYSTAGSGGNEGARVLALIGIGGWLLLLDVHAVQLRDARHACAPLPGGARKDNAWRRFHGAGMD